MTKTTMVRSASALAVCAALAACGGGAGSDDPFETALTLVDELEAADVSGNISPIAAADLPDTATLNGVFIAEIDGSDNAFVGNATVDADFSASTLTGEIDDVTEYELAAACDNGPDGCTATEIQETEGELDIAGTITGNEFTHTITGTLTGTNEGEAVSADVDLQGDGGFGTVDGRLAAAADSTGTVTVTSASGSEVVDAEGALLVTE
ncbi:MAG: hypothetical protein ACU0DW_07580 [Shimia sp.]